MSGAVDPTNEKEFFVKSLIKGPLAKPIYIISGEPGTPGRGEWFYGSEHAALSYDSSYNDFYGFTPVERTPPGEEWPDEYINIQYPDYITVHSYGDVPPAEGTDASGSAGDWTYTRQLSPGEDGGQWFCPDRRVLLGAGKCVRSYYVGNTEGRFENVPVRGGPRPPTWPTFREWPYDSWRFEYPNQVHWPPVDLKINFGQSIYNTLTFDPEPDFMQIRVSFTSLTVGSYNGSPNGGRACAIGHSGMTGYKDWMDGQAVGCSDSILYHPTCDAWVDTGGFPYGIMIENSRPTGEYDETFKAVWTPGPTGTFQAYDPARPPGTSIGVTSDGTTIPGASVVPALHNAFGTFISGNGYFRSNTVWGGIEPMWNLGGYLVRDPEGAWGPPVWEGEPGNPYNRTLWHYRELDRLGIDNSPGPYGTSSGGGCTFEIEFYWLPPDTDYTPDLQFGDVKHHLRHVRRRVGGRG